MGEPNWGKVSGDLRAARKKGRKTVNNQTKDAYDRYSKSVDKTLKGLDSFNDALVARIRAQNKRSLAFAKEQVTDAQRVGVQAVGSSGVAGDMALGSARVTAAKAGVRHTRKTGAATTTAAKSTARGARQSVKSLEFGGKKANKQTQKLLDVIDTYKQAEDIRYIQDQRMAWNQMEFQARHEMAMQQMGFEQQKFMAEYNQRLNQEWTEWQMDNGLLLTPEEQAALDWRYRKQEINLSYRMEDQKANKEGNQAQFHNFVNQSRAVEDAVQTTMEIQHNPARREQVLSKYTDPNTGALTVGSEADAIYDYVSKLSASQMGMGPGGQQPDVSAVNKAIRYTIENRPEAERGEITTQVPKFRDVRGWIGETSPEMSQYLASNPNLEKVHQHYRAIRFAQSTLDPTSPVTAAAIENRDVGYYEKQLDAGSLGDVLEAQKLEQDAINSGMSYQQALALQAQGKPITGPATRGIAGVVDETVQDMASWLRQPGTFNRAISEAIARTGVVNPYADASTVSASPRVRGMTQTGQGPQAARVMSSLGVNKAIIDSASEEYRFVAGGTDAQLQRAYDLMDAASADGDRAHLDDVVAGSTGIIEGAEWSNEQLDLIKARYKFVLDKMTQES